MNSRIQTRLTLALWPLALVALGMLAEGRFIFYRLFTLVLLLGILWSIHRYLIKDDTGFLLSVLGLSLLAGFTTIAPGDIQSPDSFMWWQLSRGEVEDIGWLLYRPKLYVWFLKLFPDAVWVPWAQWVVHGAMLGVLYLLLKRQNWHVLAQGGALAAFGLNSLWHQGKNGIHDTTLFSFFCLFCYYLFLRAQKGERKWTLAYGVCAGLCTLTRQLADPFLVLGFALLVVRRQNRTVALVISIMLFMVVGWLGMGINRVQYGVPKRTVALGVNLFTHTAYYKWDRPTAEDRNLMETISGQSLSSPVIWNSHYSSNIDWFANALPHQYQRHLEAEGLTRLESDRFLTGAYFRWVAKNPGIFLKSGINEFKRFLFKSEEYTPRSFLARIWSVPEGVQRWEKYALHFPLWFLFSIFLLTWRRKTPLEVTGAVGISLGYLLMLSFIHVGFTRYVLPILPFLYLGWGGALHSFFTWTRGLRYESIR